MEPIFAGSPNVYNESSVEFSDKIPVGLPVEEMMEFKDLLGAVPHKRVMCSLTHGAAESCSQGFFQIFAAEFPRAMKLYTPLNIVSPF